MAALVVLAGCAGATTGGSTVDSRTDGGATTTTDRGTAPFTASSRPDPDKRVTLENEANRTVAVRLRVVRVATNATVHDATYDLAPGASREVYSLADADPQGVERFRVAVSSGDGTESVTVETSTCYGGVYGTVRADGSLGLTYAAC